MVHIFIIGNQVGHKRCNKAKYTSDNCNQIKDIGGDRRVIHWMNKNYFAKIL